MALESVETQRAGLVFIYDMTESKYANFDYDLSQKILTLLKVTICFPRAQRRSVVIILTSSSFTVTPFVCRFPCRVVCLMGKLDTKSRRFLLHLKRRA